MLFRKRSGPPGARGHHPRFLSPSRYRQPDLPGLPQAFRGRRGLCQVDPNRGPRCALAPRRLRLCRIRRKSSGSVTKSGRSSHGIGSISDLATITKNILKLNIFKIFFNLTALSGQYSISLSNLHFWHRGCKIIPVRTHRLFAPALTPPEPGVFFVRGFVSTHPERKISAKPGVHLLKLIPHLTRRRRGIMQPFDLMTCAAGRLTRSCLRNRVCAQDDPA